MISTRMLLDILCHNSKHTNIARISGRSRLIDECQCASAGSNWVDPPKRERKRVVNYAENEYFRQAMKSGAGPRAAGVRLPKMPQLQVGSHKLDSHLEAAVPLPVPYCAMMLQSIPGTPEVRPL